LLRYFSAAQAAGESLDSAIAQTAVNTGESGKNLADAVVDIANKILDKGITGDGSWVNTMLQLNDNIRAYGEPGGMLSKSFDGITSTIDEFTTTGDRNLRSTFSSLIDEIEGARDRIFKINAPAPEPRKIKLQLEELPKEEQISYFTIV